MVGSSVRAVLLASFVALPLVACSDDDDEEEETVSGTCNGVAAESTCSEFEGSSSFIDDEKQWCDELGDTWTTDPCPTLDLLGCCRETFGPEVFVDCYYTGFTLDAMALEEQCALFDGTWTAGGRG